MILSPPTKHLTVLYEPGRLDEPNGNVPFSGVPGGFFYDKVIKPLGLDPKDIEVRMPADYFRPLHPSTCVLSLGTAACRMVLADPALNKHRGYRKTFKGRPLMLTYSHMDCWEFKDEDDEDDEEAAKASDHKDVAVTRRNNYLFWAIADAAKLLRPVSPHAACKTFIAPALETVIDLLLRAPQGTHLILDIETRIQDNSLDAIGLGLMSADCTYVYVLPIYTHNNRLYYPRPKLAAFWRAFYTFLLRKDITVVGHNLFFDLSILHHYYGLPFPSRIHDTMLFMHRDNANIDKSLSHAISYYTDATENHKGDLCPNVTRDNFDKLLVYNSKDIYWTGEVYRRQKQRAAQIPKLSAADEIGQRTGALCLLMSFTGITVDNVALGKAQADLMLKLQQLQRIAGILTGLPKFNCNSPDQVGAWFYDVLEYEAPELSPTGNPSTDEKTLYKLQLKQPNPLLPVILSYRATKKELSMLQFKHYERPIL